MFSKRDSVVLLNEAMFGLAEGNEWTYFVEGYDAIVPLLDRVTAEEASITPYRGGGSIGAHAIHIRYILHAANAYDDNQRPTGTWDDTWARNEVTAEEWDALRVEIKERYQRFITWLQRDDIPPPGAPTIAVLTILPHLAYHLGAMYQLHQLQINSD